MCEIMIWSAINKCILQQFFLQDYDLELWNPSKTKIPITIGKGTDAANPYQKPRTRGNEEWNTGTALAPKQFATPALPLHHSPNANAWIMSRPIA